MLAAIYFHRQAQLRTIEINGESTDWMLLSETKPAQLVTAERPPKSSLSISHVCAEISCTSRHFFRAVKA
jgi:hypothetical protein